MAGWLALENGSSLNWGEIVQTFRSIGFCLDIDSYSDDSFDKCNDRLRWLFDQMLSVFLKEVIGRECIRPVMIGDGHAVDLFKLFWFVRGRGGYDLVSKNNMWGLVLEDCEFDPIFTAAVKLIYFKYLYRLDQCIGTVQCKFGGKLDALSLDLEIKNDKTLKLEPKLPNKNGRSSVMDAEKIKANILAVVKACERGSNNDKCPEDDDEKYSNDEEILLRSLIPKNNCCPRKRKLGPGSLSTMLNWIIQVAKQPQNCEDLESKRVRAQVLLAREARLLKNYVDPNAGEKKLKLHPSMYDDNVSSNDRLREGLRCSKRLPTLSKFHLCPCCKPQLATETASSSPRKAGSKYALASPRKATTKCASINSQKVATECASQKAESELESLQKKRVLNLADPLVTDTTNLLGDEPVQKEVPVGPQFQAKIPYWTGEVTDSDSKWLGTRIWPLETKGCVSQDDMNPIGKGRQDLCSCMLPGSVNCIRFHTAEKRMKLKLELGALFYTWRFDRMGEEVSLSWTIEEEKKFKSIVRLNRPSQEKCFWNDAFRVFPRKTRESLVSYYFNVFLVRRRSYQNRVTPKGIDSDDDESDFGSFSDGFGLERVKLGHYELQVCSENKQCFELDPPLQISG